jgi:hypothetical protein
MSARKPIANSVVIKKIHLDEDKWTSLGLLSHNMSKEMQTRISVASLIREGVDMILEKYNAQ